GRDIAARLAVRTGGGLLVDAVDVRAADGHIFASHSVFGGAYTTESAVEGGLPIITVRQGAIDARADAVQQTVTTASVTVASRSANIDSVSAAANSGRPELRTATRV